MERRGQSSVELIIVLSAIMILLAFIYVASQSQLTASQNVVRVSQARASVVELARAANYVYYHGPGSRVQVFVTIPDGAAPQRMGVFNETYVNIGVYISGTVTDVNEKVSVPRVVQGANFPTQPGGYWVWVTAKEGYVIIGDISWDIKPAQVALEMLQNSSTGRTLVATNYLNSSVNVSLVLDWSHGAQISVSLNGSASQDLVLAPSGATGDAATLNLQLAALPGAPLGAYAGFIAANGSDGQVINVPLFIQVVGQQGGGPPTNVSYVLIDTWNDSAYTVPQTIFDPTETVDIHGSGFTSNSNVSIRVYNPSAALVHSNETTSNSSGGFAYYWNPGGGANNPPGTYNVTANDSSRIASWLFNITGCT